MGAVDDSALVRLFTTVYHKYLSDSNSWEERWERRGERGGRGMGRDTWETGGRGRAGETGEVRAKRGERR